CQAPARREARVLSHRGGGDAEPPLRLSRGRGAGRPLSEHAVRPVVARSGSGAAHRRRRSPRGTKGATRRSVLVRKLRAGAHLVDGLTRSVGREWATTVTAAPVLRPLV